MFKTNPISVITKIRRRIKDECEALSKAEESLAKSIEEDAIKIKKIETEKVAKTQAASESQILRTNLEKLFKEPDA